MGIRGATAVRKGTSIGPRVMSRRGFLKLGGAGLAGTALLGAAGCNATSASRWKFPAVYTWSDSEETIRNYYGRDLKPHARTTATADRAHGSSARDARARAFDATDEQYSRTGAPGAH